MVEGKTYLVYGQQVRLSLAEMQGFFCVSLLLYNGVPMEIVSELLGHSKMSITQNHYGKVVQKKVSEQKNV